MTADFAARVEAAARAMHEARRKRGVFLPPWEDLPDHRKIAKRWDAAHALWAADAVEVEATRKGAA